MKFKSRFLLLTLCILIKGGAQARYYDPAGGRFISPDSIIPNAADPQSLNRYAYVRNNPLNLIDPSGHSWISHATGVHVNANRLIHHNIGINQINFGAYAGPGAEMSFYFSDDDVKVGGGVGGGIGFHLGTSFNSFDVQTSQGAYMSVGYDPYAGSYISGGGGMGVLNGTAAFYPETRNYQLGGGITYGRTGIGASYSSVDGTQLNAGGYGIGAGYNLKSSKTRYSVNPAAFGGYTKQDKNDVDYSGFDPKKSYGGPGGIGDALVPDFWWSKAFYAHDKLFGIGKGPSGFFYADQTMASEMTTESIGLIRSHPFLAPILIPTTALLVPLYYSAVAVPGALYYPFANAK